MHHYYRKGKFFLCYNIVGNPKGYPIVFVHGWSQCMHKWSPLDNYLKEYQLVMIDLPGFGNASDQPEAANVVDTLGLLYSFIQYISKERGWTEKCIGVGYSYGAIFIEELQFCYGLFRYSFLIDDCRYMKKGYLRILKKIAKYSSKIVHFVQRHKMEWFVKCLGRLVMHKEALPADILVEAFNMDYRVTKLWLEALPEYVRERMDISATHIVGKYDKYIDLKRLPSTPVSMLHSAHNPIDEDTQALAICIDRQVSNIIEDKGERE